MNLEQSASVDTVADAFADDLSGIDDVFKDSVVHMCKSARHWPLLLGLPLRLARGLRQDGAACQKDHSLAVELLLQLTRTHIKKFTSFRKYEHAINFLPREMFWGSLRPVLIVAATGTIRVRLISSELFMQLS